MPTVELLFSALPEHVRTARLVAAAVARRAGVDEAVLDEVRLAVGEACSRAVGLHRSSGEDRPVHVRLTEEEKKFTIEVGDNGPDPSAAGPSVTGTDASNASVPAARTDGPAEHPAPHPDGVDSSETSEAEDESQMGLAVISGLVDDVEVVSGEYGDVIRMSWPLNPVAL
ncbi:ATP-binding protein [Streptomyces sp. NPDC058691]|uniref:ATP-binding protein n=1 Tax=Streptomyces sp. NPDC058691 TaxID=3346601 RepID=UPI00364A7DD9